MWRRALNLFGRVLVGAGLLLLLFTAYQLWGTTLTEHEHQAALRSQLNRELPSGAAALGRRLADHPGARPSPPRSHKPTGPVPPRTAPPTPDPAPGQPVGSIDIPSIGLDQVIVEGVAENDLMLGPGHYVGTSLPGQAGNAAIAGHRTTYGHPFYNLDAVAPGDKIIVTTPQGVFVYTAVRTEVVPPTDVAVLDQTPDPELTLTTCNPRYSAATRMVLHADLTSSTLLGAAASPTTTTTTTAPGKPRRPRPQAAALAGENAAGNWLPAILWGLAVAAALVLTWYLGRRLALRWAVYLVGTLAVLFLLFWFFGAVSPLLPASF